MIEYAFSQRKVNPNMAVDVLLSGLSYASPQSDPGAAARLHLALAHIEAERNAWAKVSSHAASGLGLLTASSTSASASAAASAASQPAAADLIMGAAGTGARALLIQGLDAEALALTEQAERALRAASSASASTSSPAPSAASSAHTRSLGLLALTAHAAGGPAAASAAASSLHAALGPHAGLSAALKQQPVLADAVQTLGLLAAARGTDAEAEAAFAAAAEGAAAARSGAAAAAGGSGLEAEAAQQHSYEVEADALAGRAQLQMRAKEWGQAEELLGAALKAAEASSGDRSPALAPLLTLLGYTYSRSARVTFAEGLFREAAKLLRLDPGRQQPPPDGPAARAAAAGAGVHASAAAVLAWRYAQLLWVLPNRAGEAAKWEAFARQYWAGSGRLGAADIAGVLGGEGHLKGEGEGGSGVLLSTRFRRAWQCE
eukprot:XP_001691753.1 predicted protein [Chlamydomonas reinhardtii]